MLRGGPTVPIRASGGRRRGAHIAASSFHDRFALAHDAMSTIETAIRQRTAHPSVRIRDAIPLSWPCSATSRTTSRPSNAPPPEQPRRLDRPVDRKKGTTPPCRPLQAHQPARTYIRHCPRAAGNPGCVGRIGSLAVPSLVRLAPLGVRQAAGQRWRRDRPSHWGDTHAQHDCGSPSCVTLGHAPHTVDSVRSMVCDIRPPELPERDVPTRSRCGPRQTRRHATWRGR